MKVNPTNLLLSLSVQYSGYCVQNSEWPLPLSGCHSVAVAGGVLGLEPLAIGQATKSCILFPRGTYISHTIS